MMSEVSLIKRAAATVLNSTGLTSLSFALQRAALSPFIRVVYYHDVPATMSEAFTRQLMLLKQAFVPASKLDLARLLSEGYWPHDRPGIIVTFDDGLRSHSEVVAPILDRLGFQGWFFVPVDLIAMDPAEQPEGAVRHCVLHHCDTARDPRVFMSQQQLVDLSERHIVGCHTATHVRLSRELTDNQLHSEINSAKRRLESVLGRDVDAFSWVGGEEWAYSPAAARCVAGLFDYAFTTNTCLTRRGTPGLRIDRTHVEASFPAALVRLQLSGMMDLYYRSKRRRLDSCLGVVPEHVPQA
jgi:peptidoglycan/xylan/chitin deacetylase (PgdA/CDA1 family)